MLSGVLYVPNASSRSLRNQLFSGVETPVCRACGFPFIDMRSQKFWLVVYSPSAPRSPCLNPWPVGFSKVTEISMGEFLMHSSVVWLNPHPSLGRIRKDPEMTVFGESAPSPPPPHFYRHPRMVTDETLISTNSTVYWVCCTARQECLQQRSFNIRSWNAAVYFKASCWHLKASVGCFPSVSFSPRGIRIQKWDTDVFSLTSFQESGDIGLQGKQQAEEEDGKSCFSCTHSYMPQNWIFGLKCRIFFPPLLLPAPFPMRWPDQFPFSTFSRWFGPL